MATEGAGLTSRQTVEAARAGDEGAWRTLFEQHFERLARFFRWRVASDEIAEDLAAEVFADAYRGLEKFRWRNRPFEAWLFAIARNRLALQYRRRRDEATLDFDVEHRSGHHRASRTQNRRSRLLKHAGSATAAAALADHQLMPQCNVFQHQVQALREPRAQFHGTLPILLRNLSSPRRVADEVLAPHSGGAAALAARAPLALDGGDVARPAVPCRVI